MIDCRFMSEYVCKDGKVSVAYDKEIPFYPRPDDEFLFNADDGSDFYKVMGVQFCPFFNTAFVHIERLLCKNMTVQALFEDIVNNSGDLAWTEWNPSKKIHLKNIRVDIEKIHGSYKLVKEQERND